MSAMGGEPVLTPIEAMREVLAIRNRRVAWLSHIASFESDDPRTGEVSNRQEEVMSSDAEPTATGSGWGRIEKYLNAVGKGYTVVPKLPFNRLAGLGRSLAELFWSPSGFTVANGMRLDWTVGGPDHAHAGTFDRGGVLEPGWKTRVRKNTQALLSPGEPVFRLDVARRCCGGGRRFFDGVDWRCWTCHRLVER